MRGLWGFMRFHERAAIVGISILGAISVTCEVILALS